MECIEARALKSSVLSQMAAKPNSQVFNHSDDVWCLAGITDVLPLPDDNFLVEDLLNLDFSEKEHHEDCFPHVDEEQKVSQESNGNHSSATFSSGGTDELVLPFDDLENLEWLSQYVDESAAELSLLCPAGGLTANAGLSRGERMERVARPVQKTTAPFSPSPVPRKARTKLPTRPLSRRPWHLPSADSLPLTFPNESPSLPPFMVGKLPVKRQRRTPEADSSRKCTHCQANRTPQWRTGPLGPKTLCNACGVRFKSGRLFPEYRPACSPTFSREMHSNSHRKVLEIRSKKSA